MGWREERTGTWGGGGDKKLKKEIFNIVGKYLDTSKYKLFFFGSRVSGRGNDRSDIDIGIEGLQEVSSEVMAKIKQGIKNLPMLYIIEIIDFKNVSPDFYKVASVRQEYLWDNLIIIFLICLNLKP